MLGMNPFVYVEFSAEALSLGRLGLPGLFAPLRRLCLLGLLRLQWHFFQHGNGASDDHFGPSLRAQSPTTLL